MTLNNTKTLTKLKENKDLQLSIFIYLVSYLLSLYKINYIYFFLLSYMYLSYNFCSIYYDNTKKYFNIFLVFVDLIYFSLFSIDIRYIIVYIIVLSFLSFYNTNKDRKQIFNNIKFYGIYTAIKLISFILLIFI